MTDVANGREALATWGWLRGSGDDYLGVASCEEGRGRGKRGGRSLRGSGNWINRHSGIRAHETEMGSTVRNLIRTRRVYAVSQRRGRRSCTGWPSMTRTPDGTRYEDNRGHGERGGRSLKRGYCEPERSKGASAVKKTNMPPLPTKRRARAKGLWSKGVGDRKTSEIPTISGRDAKGGAKGDEAVRNDGGLILHNHPKGSEQKKHLGTHFSPDAWAPSLLTAIDLDSGRMLQLRSSSHYFRCVGNLLQALDVKGSNPEAMTSMARSSVPYIPKPSANPENNPR
ncbi:hypothetical protein BDK51DRAFT_45448 [Blyttiomyces helicus]|uniref:Uncharacterized protein n=1 Tax=Blyttiomyces helicus TaxID=388810 RepID=A0A4P9WGF8_9FUNG|nr:hypothetical protein BDK51DRAFT_45448 [Blyttiomyces helicus]|eukprot:RKO90903.1 hypothetical protein BDK51DRAFT_45448 [Blyttiomyces helicus]